MLQSFIMSSHIDNRTLAGVLWPSSSGFSGFARALVLCVTGSAVLTISAKIQIPFYPVPMTLQTLVVLTIGLAFGAKLAAGTVLLYLLEGAAGLPVFAKGGGLAYLAGPTAGYLFGFLVAAYCMGLLAERGWGKNVLTTFFAMLIGQIILYVPGLVWLAYVLSIEPAKAVALGLTPFLYGAAAKIALAMALLPTTWRAVDSYLGRDKK